MVRTNVTLEYLDVSTLTDLSDQLPHALAYRPTQSRLAVLRYENHVVVQPVNGVRSFPVPLARPYRKPPKGFA